jgi:hypothetical protein
MMGKDDDGNSLDRRIFLGASTATLLGLPGISLAQQQRQSGPGKVSDPTARAPSQSIADFVTGFDLKSAPPIVIERARIAFVDTVGVMLAGSQLPPADIVCDIIKLEGSAPVATIVGRPLRTSPQLAALANGVAGHAMDFDLNTAGQSVVGVIPAILPVAETTGATPAEMLATFAARLSQEGFVDLSALRSCINVSGLQLEHLLRATMDISARAVSLAGRPQVGHLGHQGSHAPGRPSSISSHPLADLGR